MMKRQQLLLIGIVLIATGVSGCSRNQNVRIVGNVTLDGAPLENGEVRFVPADGKSQPAGSLIKAGKYAALVPLGPKTVHISAYKEVGQERLYADVPNSPTVPITKVFFEKTMSYEVTSAGEKDFELKTK